MNKLVTVLGVAAVATFAGCKDPNYKPMGFQSQNEVKTATAIPDAPEEVHCTCPANTKHTSPCVCGAPDCKCEVVNEPTVVEPPNKTEPPKSVESEYTIYIVQKGDYLAKISKKYNITINSIKELNGLKDDKIRLGQKLKLPGKVDVGEQTVPEGAIAKPVKKAYTPYTGETVEYTVKSGDTLGAIAYGNGINIRQLKELNGLSKDNLKIGQKLKIPANGKAARAASAETPVKTVATQKQTDKVEPIATSVEPASVPEPAVEPTDAASTALNDVATEPTTAPAPAAMDTYVVQEGEDLMAISIASGVSLSTLRELNNLPEDAKLTAGQVLKLPAEE